MCEEGSSVIQIVETVWPQDERTMQYDTYNSHSVSFVDGMNAMAGWLVICEVGHS